MPRIIPEQYECTICRRVYANIDDAVACENRLIPEYPIGCIYGNHIEEGYMYKDITFAVASNNALGHINIGSSWACRDNNPYGDSLGKHTCGGNDLNLSNYQSKLNVKHPTFIRMVNWLKENNIPVTVWDGEKPISLDEYINK